MRSPLPVDRESRQPLTLTSTNRLSIVSGLSWTTTLTILVVAFLVLVLIYVQLSPRDNGDVWIRYDTLGSKGPRYQLQFDHHNVTSWRESHAHGNGEWALRIDDQAMIPAELLDEEESHYQQWFQRHFPEANEIREKELYLDPSFLGDPYSIQVPADMRFHTAHCVLALRRYWKARESGQHVCPRDIDHRHIKHCLDSPDEMAFPESPGDSSQGNKTIKDQQDNPIVLLWKTKICW